jgi:hypothetical protein
MMQDNPADRPSAEQALQHWRSIRREVRCLHRCWRPREREESFLTGLRYDIYYIFSATAHTCWSFVRRLCRLFV